MWLELKLFSLAYSWHECSEDLTTAWNGNAFGTSEFSLSSPLKGGESSFVYVYLQTLLSSCEMQGDLIDGSARQRSGFDLPDRSSDSAEFIRRIRESEALRRSGRLKELLAYLVKHSASYPDTPVSEHDIGTDVYRRRPDYDTSHDTIVRVQVAQLRKKLERYYETEGAHDELILTIPRGRYQAHWHSRTITPEIAEPSSPTAVAPARARQRWLPFAIALGLSLVLAIGLVMTAIPKREAWQNNAAKNSPSVAKLWSSLLVPGKTTHIVLSDPGIVMLAVATGQRVRFSELGDRLFMNRLDSMSGEDHFTSFLRSVTASQLTTLSDLELVRRITALGLSDPGMMNIVAARDFRIRELNAQNTILVGYGLSNPWVEVFQQSTNFVMDVDYTTNSREVINLHPNAGESPRYVLGDSKKNSPAQGFATVALFPNPTISGKTLIISGADVPGTESAIRFLMSEELWDPFYRRIAIKGEIPSFEVVLAYRRLSNSSGNVVPVAWRVH